MRWRPTVQLSLRERVSVTFGTGAFALSVLLALTTYTVATDYLWSQRLDTTVRQAAFHARAVDDAWPATRPAVKRLLARVDENGGRASRPLLIWDGEWHDIRFAPGHRALPAAFRAAAENREAVTQRFRTTNSLAVAIAVPVNDGTYVEVVALRQLDKTLSSLSMIFVLTTTMTTLLGLLMGGWASRRALRPLTSVTTAASAIAEGDLAARLDVHSDRDLAPIAEAFNRTASRLQARVERDARFAANVSHELRSPLTTMVNAVDVLRARGNALDPEAREVLELLADDVHRFARTVNDLLEISRLDADAVQPTLEPVHLGEFVRSVADRCAGRPVTRVEDGVDPVVAIDKRRIERVIENLMQNADLHGGGAVCVDVSVTPSEFARISIEDHGPGIPEAQRERIFQRFTRATRADSSATGAGLGLALVAEHVKLHGGRVWVDAVEGGGARFIAELPQVRP